MFHPFICMIKSYFASENNQQTQRRHHINNRFNWSIASCMLISFLWLGNTAHSQNPLEQVIQEKIDQMSVAEKVKQIHGKDMWSTEDNTNLDIPGIVVSDGPHGVRFVDATAFPTGMGIAALYTSTTALISSLTNFGLGTSAVKDISEAHAIKWITVNAAKSLGIDDKTGSLEAGKQGDVVIWNQSPFSVYAKAEQVFVDGAKVYDRNDSAFQAQSDFMLGQQ